MTFDAGQLSAQAKQASLNGKFNTSVTKEWINNNRHLKILDDSTAIIRSFSLTFSGVSSFSLPPRIMGDSITDEAKNTIMSLRKGAKIYFNNVSAFQQSGLPILTRDFYIRIE